MKLHRLTAKKIQDKDKDKEKEKQKPESEAEIKARISEKIIKLPSQVL